MAVKLINAKISAQTLTFKPGGSPATFEVTVVNDSNQFSSFQLEIIAAGSNSNLGANWYTISPAVSAKIPPGDSTRFLITITDTPVAGFVGKMNMVVRIFSLELREEDRQLLRLVIVPGTGTVPMQLKLPIREFTAQPEGRIEILVNIYNPSQLPANISLRILGLVSKWVLNPEQNLKIPPGEEISTSFFCQLPSAKEVPSQSYAFTVEANRVDGTPGISPEGVINIQPAGEIDFQCFPLQRQIPVNRLWLPQWRKNSTNYQFEYHNASNISSLAGIEVSNADEKQRPCVLEIHPETVELKPGETEQLELVVSQRRRWFGWTQKLGFIVQSRIPDLPGNVNVKNEKHILKLTIHPILHPWLQLVLIVLLLFLVWSISWLNPESPFFGHKRSVASVEFNGTGQEAISGSKDQSIIKWNVSGLANPLINPYAGKMSENINKSVRVVRYKPVNNDVIAAGLENGEIQIWDAISGDKKPKIIFSSKKDDRVFDLRFSQSSRYLFSGHGSGLVLQWDIEDALLSSNTSSKDSIKLNNPLVMKKFDHAIYSMALAGKDKDNLVVGQRHNNLDIWNWKQDKIVKIPYKPNGAQDDYIVSLASAAYKPSLLAVADNQGKISLWNMQSCLDKNGSCQVIDQWVDGHRGKPVRSVALSSDGCYLVSGGDDNRVVLWPLTKEGKRELLTGEEVLSGNYKFNSVDIKMVKKQILVLSGDDRKQVRLNILDGDRKSRCIQ